MKKPRLQHETKMRTTASALIGALLLALTLSSAPRLHALLHKDSSALNHDCAVTLIASGSYDHSAAPVIVVAPQPAEHVATVATFISVWVASPFLGASIFEHAPPALS